MKKQHPIQPMELDECGVLRFKRNGIVRLLLDDGKYDLNTLSSMVQTGKLEKEDYVQLMQLIGYSWSGAGDLSCMPDEIIEAAHGMYYQDKKEEEARYSAALERIKHLEDEIKEIYYKAADAVGVGFHEAEDR